MPEKHYLPVTALRVGHYIHLDLKWFEHPFAFSHFKLKSEEQLRIIHGLGLERVCVDLELSDESSSVPSTAPPASAPEPPPAPTSSPAPAAPPEPSPAMLAKRQMMAQMRERREQAERVAQAFLDTAEVIRAIERNLDSHPTESVAQAANLIATMTESLLAAPELAIQVMGEKSGDEEVYFHSLNVTMLSMMVARALTLPVPVIQPLGIGALLHDIGKREVPDRILKKIGPLTPSERSLYEMHCHYGLEIGQRLKLHGLALAIITEHHELFDGSGFPAQRQGEAISLLARIVAIANYYDRLCNPLVLSEALTPHEALSVMFSRLRHKFDPKLLQIFIRCLGVYPPGTIVQLSNGYIGMVTTVNTERPMKPLILVYDADLPKEEAMLLDMEHETGLNISKAIRPGQVPIEVYNYLSPRKRVSYYFDSRPGHTKDQTP